MLLKFSGMPNLVTMHIQLLEEEFQVKLFERLGHKIKITQQGEQLLYYAEKILAFSEEAVLMNPTLGTLLLVKDDESVSFLLKDSFHGWNIICSGCYHYNI